MSYEKALRQIEFLEKNLDGAIVLSKIEQTRYLVMPQEHLCTNRYYEWCDFDDEPGLAKYTRKEKKK